MQQADAQAHDTRLDWHDSLRLTRELGLPSQFNFEWLIDRAERGEWSGRWW